MKNDALKSGLFAILFIVVLLLVSSVYTVREGQNALLLRLGKLVVDKDKQILVVSPGLHFKYPFINSVRVFDTRLQTLDIKSSRIVTQEKKDVIVDYYVKWRISDLSRYFKATDGNAFNAESLLEQLLNTSLRAEFGKRTIGDVVSGERDDVMEILRKKAEINAAGLGITVKDVRIKGIDLPPSTSSAIYQRMRADMLKIANRHRADGRGEAEAIEAEADKEVTVILASARSSGEKVRAKGQAQAAKIYAGAYGQAPDFLALYLSLKAYQKTFSSKSDILVLNQKGQFFDYFGSSKPPKSSRN